MSTFSKAREILRGHWGQREFHQIEDGEDRYCAVGAVARAYELTTKTRLYDDTGDVPTENSSAIIPELRAILREILLRDQDFKPTGPWDLEPGDMRWPGEFESYQVEDYEIAEALVENIATWNDRSDRTEDEVLEVLTAAEERMEQDS
jgi:hypothetical protein